MKVLEMNLWNWWIGYLSRIEMSAQASILGCQIMVQYERIESATDMTRVTHVYIIEMLGCNSRGKKCSNTGEWKAG